MDKKSVSAELTAKKLVIDGLDFPSGLGDGQWVVLEANAHRIHLTSKKSQSLMEDCNDGYLKVDSDVAASLFLGLIKRGFTGVVSVETGFGCKRVHLHNGKIVFARSNLIDDRLGEVIYRLGLIQIDQMTQSAVQVTRDKKFGKVLLDSDIFSSYDLWNALKLQVKEIVQSIFLPDSVYIQIQSGEVPLHSYVIFPEGPEVLLETVSSLGRMFRMFQNRLKLGGAIKLREGQKTWHEPLPGTFEGDIVQLVRNSKTIAEFVEKSKLQKTNTLLELFRLYYRRLVSLELEAAPQLDYGMGLSQVKGKIDAYKILLKSATKAFEEEKTTFPVADLIYFVDESRNFDNMMLQLDSTGDITPESAQYIFFDCIENRKQINNVVFCLDSLIMFLQQLAFDFLPMIKAKDLQGRFNDLVR
ncbi:MAG: DUF4388 domain-containing protein [Oligoflexales bacterium]